MISQKLHWNGAENGRDEGVPRRQFCGRRGNPAQAFDALGIGKEDNPAAAGDDLLHVAGGLFDPTANFSIGESPVSQ